MMMSIFKRELKSYFTSFTGYIFIFFFLLATGIYSWFINYINQNPYFEYVIFNLNFLYLIAIPILTMRAIAEEKKQKTDKLLYSLPLSSLSIVLGKYLAIIVVLAVPMAIICIYPLILSIFGTISLPTCYSTIIGFFLLGAALTSIGLFVSSISDNQIVSAAATFAVIFIGYLSSTISSAIPTSAFASFFAFAVISAVIAILSGIVTKNVLFATIVGAVFLAADSLILLFFPTALEGLLQKVMNSLSVFDRLSYFVTGIFDLTSVVYYLSISALVVFFTIQSYEKRRWS